MIRSGIRRAFRLALRRRDRWEREVEEEIMLHLTLRAEQLAQRGATPADAYDEAVRRFGPLRESRARLLTAARHRERRMHRTEYIADLRQDLAFALRTLRRDAGWATVTVLTLALGIGATTAVFSAVSSLLLHSVAYPHADRVVLLYQQPMRGNNTGISVTVVPAAPVIRAWKAARSFEAIEAFGPERVELSTRAEPVKLNAVRIEPTFPRFADVRPLLGRMFTDDEIAGGGRQALLGEGLWRERFGADSGVIGKSITLDDSSYSVVGVLPATLRAPNVGGPATDIWLPIDLRNDKSGAQVVGRLRPGVDGERARVELDSLHARSSQSQLSVRAVVTTPAQRLSFHDSLIMLAGAVSLVLLVACANVAHLLMARSMSRRRELAIRVALGAGHGRVFRQLLTESLVLATVGGTLGVFTGWLGLRAIVALRPPALSALTAAHVDATTLMIALGVTLATSVAFGLVGAIHSARQSTNDALKGTASRARMSSRGRGRQLLVVTEMALSATLVVGATMLVRSVVNMQNADLGFEPYGLYTMGLSWPKKHFSSATQRADVYRALATRLLASPGTRSVALASTAPTWRQFSIGRLEVDGNAKPGAPATSFIDVNQVGSGYFSTMGIRLVEGAGFTDTTPAANQIIVNERFARKQWNGASALGKRLRISRDGNEPWLTVVGVARDASTGGPMLTESSAPYLYSPAADSDAVAVLLRASESEGLLARLQSLARTVDPAITVKVDAVEQQVSQSIAAPRFVMLLLTVFTVLALALAAIGLYGVMAHGVAQRTREIGIRVALGATRGRIARSVVAGGVSLAVIGCVLGATASIWGTKLIESQLYGVATRDPISFAAAVIILFAAAVLACIVPARRALAVDPMTAIRAD